MRAGERCAQMCGRLVCAVAGACTGDLPEIIDHAEQTFTKLAPPAVCGHPGCNVLACDGTTPTCRARLVDLVAELDAAQAERDAERDRALARMHAGRLRDRHLVAGAVA